MKLFDKIKDLFMDEVVEDEEEEEEFPEPIEKPKKEKKKDELPKVMQDIIKKEEKDIEIKPEKKNNHFSEEDFNALSFKEETRENNPVKDFGTNFDFVNEVPQRRVNRNVMDDFEFSSKIKSKKKEEEKATEPIKKVSELYTKKEEVIEKPKFKASPVISPVYGVLDKNYKKDEVKEKSEEMVEMKRPSKKVDFETVRRKAFGNLVEDIKDNLLCENCELYKEVKKISALKEDDLLYDMTVDDTKELTIEKAYDNYEEFGVAYEPKKTNEESEEDDSKLEDMLLSQDIVEDSQDSIINDNNSSEKEEIVLEKEEAKIEEVTDEGKLPSRESKKKETKVDEDFFELIDSMYKERVDE